MKNKFKILFVCKHNMFRSRVAEAYFKKINKNKNIEVGGAGIIKGFYPLVKSEIDASKSLGIDINGKPRGLSIDMVRGKDLIIIVADDVPKITFNRKEYIDFRKTKVVVWKIKDNLGGNGSMEVLKKIISSIMKKVDELNKDLDKKLK